MGQRQISDSVSYKEPVVELYYKDFALPKCKPNYKNALNGGTF